MRLSRMSIVHAGLMAFAVLLIAQAARVQILQGEQWAERARRQQFRTGPVTGTRGRILDTSGNVLAESRELVRISIAPAEVKDFGALAKAMRSTGFSEADIRAASDRQKKWVPIKALFVASEVSQVTSLPGVHAERVVRREYFPAAGVRRITGVMDAAGRATGGMELALDRILRGDSGRSAIARDPRGRRLDSPDSWASSPRPGADVTLTINRDLQEICERALARATDSLDATGGDIVVMNPATGEILAMATSRAGARSMVNTAVTEPFEPGSTLKPFVAAALLEHGLARTDEMVPTHGGVMTLASRTITDLRRSDSLSLADVIRYSSNIGIVQFGSRLSPRQTFEMLRDLGFGTPTGVPIPGESDGTLREPTRWYAPSAASLAMGYEISVTPLQLVSAYAALANGGRLMQPHIVREIRDADGELVYRAQPRALRRVFSESVASEVRRLLRSVVDSGTGVKADLARFQLAGKSGTARRTSNGRYVEGNYTASFVGLFPAEKPQYVVLVKLDSPKGAFYGGEIAAPVSAVVLRAALAARDAALDRGELAAEERDVPGTTFASSARTAESTQTATSEQHVIAGPSLANAEPTIRPATVYPLPYVSRTLRETSPARPVPQVAGLPLRVAVRALHQSGFRVILASAQSEPTVPAAGTLLPHGSVVKLRRGP